MGKGKAKAKSKKSRKGKREWRKNIPTTDLDELVERSGREERSGGPLDNKSDESLFFVDKSGDQSLQRKIDKHRSKVLRCDTVLQRSSLVPALPASNKRKLKDRDIAKPPQKNKKPVLSKEVSDEKTEPGAFDLWEGNPGNGSKKRKGLIRDSSLLNVPAVEIDAPGCSYNPTFDDHQEALGAAVAQEMQQIYRKDLQPEPLPQVPTAVPMDEEEMFFMEADQEEDANEDEDPGIGMSRAVKVKKLTRADLNKRSRRLKVLKQDVEVQQREKLKEELNRLPEIEKTIQQEEEERNNILTRRMVSKKEKLANAPPRLGKHKFKPDSVKVLLTEEVTGSMRKLKGCYMLLKERFKSLQRRGILEPRVPARKKAPKMWVNYEPGTKGAKERESHAAMQAEREARKLALAVVPL